MKLTKEMLKEWGACSEGYAWYLKYNSDDAVEVLKQLLKEDKSDWLLWTAERLMDKKQALTLAVFCAEQVIDIFEKKYPEDKRPRKAIKAAKAWIDNPGDESASEAAIAAASVAASVAASAAWSVSDSAIAAAWAAWAASDSASVAAWAARAASDSASVAARSASAAARSACAAWVASDSTIAAAKTEMINICGNKAIEIIGVEQ